MLSFSTEKCTKPLCKHHKTLHHLASEVENYYPGFSLGKTDTQRDKLAPPKSHRGSATEVGTEIS